MQVRTVVAAILTLALLIAGCKAATPSPTPASMQGVAALVNGQPISLDLFEAQARVALASLQQQPDAEALSPETQAALRQQVLDGLIDQLLIEQAAANMGAIVTDDEVKAQVLRVKAENPSGFDAWLEANGYTAESFEAQMRADLLASLVRERVTAEIGDEVEQVHLCQILLESQAEAQQVAEEIREGVDFSTLARTRSHDESSRDAGGDLGWLSRGLLPEAVEQAAFALEPGQIAGPIASPFGWHIIYLVERDPAREAPPEMAEQLRLQAFAHWLAQEREKAAIERYVP